MSNKIETSDSFKNALHESSNRTFFYALFSLKRDSRVAARAIILRKASRDQLKLLMKVIHYILNGEIHLRKEDAGRLKESKKMPFLYNHFLHATSLKETIQKPIAKQVEILGKVTVFRQLLRNFFTHPKPN
jgi:uncharacterized membrane protein